MNVNAVQGAQQALAYRVDIEAIRRFAPLVEHSPADDDHQGIRMNRTGIVPRGLQLVARPSEVLW
jgi:hypothetical protein